MVCSCLKKTHLLAVGSWKRLSSGRAGREEGTGWVEPTVYSRLGVKDKQKPGRRLRSATAASRGQNWVASSPGSLFQGERRKQGLSTRGSHAVPVPNGRLLLGREWSHITVTLGERSRRGGCSASLLPIATLPLSSCSLGNSRAAGPSGSLLPFLGAVCLSLLRPGGCAIPGWLILIKTVLWIVEGGTVGGWETGGAPGKGLIMKWHERGQESVLHALNAQKRTGAHRWSRNWPLYKGNQEYTTREDTTATGVKEGVMYFCYRLIKHKDPHISTCQKSNHSVKLCFPNFTTNLHHYNPILEST